MEVMRKTLKLNCIKAKKDVASGIQLVKERLKVQGDGKPRLFICSRALVETDRVLEKASKSLCTAHEMVAYAWNPRKPDEPVKADDHGMDAMRYMVSHLDARGNYKVRFI
jgi:phage terminase large subunit